MKPSPVAADNRFWRSPYKLESLFLPVPKLQCKIFETALGLWCYRNGFLIEFMATPISSFTTSPLLADTFTKFIFTLIGGDKIISFGSCFAV